MNLDEVNKALASLTYKPGTRILARESESRFEILVGIATYRRDMKLPPKEMFGLPAQQIMEGRWRRHYYNKESIKNTERVKEIARNIISEIEAEEYKDWCD